MDSEAATCPVCGGPVDRVVRRHKTLGAWVPVWVSGPCRNPRCQAHPAENAADAEAARRKPGDSAAAESRQPESRQAGSAGPAARNS